MVKIVLVEYNYEDGDREELFTPTFFCDYCDKEITDGKMGLVLFMHEQDPLYDRWPGYGHVHKGLCDRGWVGSIAKGLGLENPYPHTMSYQLNTWTPQLVYSQTQPERKLLSVVAKQSPSFKNLGDYDIQPRLLINQPKLGATHDDKAR